MQPTLSEVKSWALQAGELLNAGFRKQHQVQYKGRFDLFTEVDTASEALIIEKIRSRYPDHTIITEESGLLQGNEDTWYIDPLDGTVNYSHGMPMFAVSLAYAHGNKVQLAVVYDPWRPEMFAAERGKGATLNDEPIHVSDVAELNRSLLVTGFPYELHSINNTENNLDNYEHFARRTQGVRRLGSAALDLAYVAAGRLDGYWEIKIKAWDIAAGTLIVEEAGGKVTDQSGDPDYMKPPFSCVAANPVLHQEILTELQRIKS